MIDHAQAPSARVFEIRVRLSARFVDAQPHVVVVCS
jgi:hypothetical protein